MAYIFFWQIDFLSSQSLTGYSFTRLNPSTNTHPQDVIFSGLAAAAVVVVFLARVKSRVRKTCTLKRSPPVLHNGMGVCVKEELRREELV